MFGRALALLFMLAVTLAPTAGAAQESPYLVIEADSGAVLAENRSGELWYPASLTKLMTIYLTFEALGEGRLELDSPVEISAVALAEPPSKMGFPIGTVITVENALKMLIAKSANDIAVAVAETLGGSVRSFVAEMNEAALRLGMTGTRFINPNGLPGQGQYTTARDMALLAQTIWNGFPEFRDLFTIGAISYGGRVLESANTLLEFYPGANGMKTGYTCSAGFNLVGSATRDGRTLIVVVLGADSARQRAERAAGLLNDGFTAPLAFAALPAVAAFRPESPVTLPVDRRPIFCSGQPVEGEENGEESDPTAADFILGLPLLRLDAEPVFTGGADMTARIRVDMPLPLPNPARPARDALGIDTPPDPNRVVVPFPLPRP